MAATASLAVPVVAYAASSPAATATLPQANQVITVSPVVVERNVKAGKAERIEVSVANQTQRPQELDTAFEDVAPGQDPQQDKRFVPGGAGKRGAETWLRAEPEHFTLQPGEERTVTVVATPPAGVEPGGHYAALFIRTVPKGTGTIAVRARIAVLLLLTAEGPVHHDLRLSIAPNHRIVLRGKPHWTVDVRNRGNVHELLTGRVRVHPLLGSDRTVLLPAMVVLPGAHRQVLVHASLREAPDLLHAHLGWKTVTAEGAAVPHGGGSDDAPVALLLPWWTLVILAVAVLAIWWRVRARRSWQDEDAWDEDLPEA